ncbi:MAG TPA: hypothetical protein VK092_02190, partial [Deinococcales bacterium]|nr:hypothetical protein [Deinococcales bacterium]
MALMVVIAGCAGLPGSDNISANLDGPAGFEVTDDGDEATIEIHVNEVTFKNQAGAPEAHIHSYEVQVLDASGNL